MKQKILRLIVGPTASGKTDYSIELARELKSPVISCDSRQIYKELIIGTAPPTAEQLSEVKHYFIHSHTIHSHYTAGKYEIEALSLLDELFKDHDQLVMVGGSGLYVDAVCYGIDDFPQPDFDLRESLSNRYLQEGIESLREELRIVDRESYKTIDISNPQRIIRALEVTIGTGRKFSSYKNFKKKERSFIVERTLLEIPREELYTRINNRVDSMMEAGLLEEVRSLFQYRNLTALKTVGYRELFAYIEGKCTLDEAIDLIKRNTRRYAKRQITWFKRETPGQFL
ncbi:MAG: tRNA (adenosine(37)-N6)-dimethylallyltransferase MiaA [Bacteroidetes bacterium GWE2_39_28]|nr:MAG: tRNA (adenosine(37)-N6)-dimethylallyltransferase MiaA [Bacteroidetes bacterium GWE2_39_28]OFY11650.1 MAG: tRNA (adenosine(37)-N6)-dimethylallyltransferase MiaA [Bacteroidetes bacterium GWF2_39_10]OFZ11568.1 MAG: tRNA (adenosine(37)-N6)-dimethylallyltransferase MiaA [Bacteroidetes bacterium RIFOXYC2_FULL_39_11]HCT94755.1 tRNA (adenosine(37)-N6)-dimethylallyltransferase MiaA [Rikenellaceae bacterium]HCV16241.1 tRNA (adenosine(37)-N6)-dimethylallyltransferase MiaA [Rikenellaceae bacterium]